MQVPASFFLSVAFFCTNGPMWCSGKGYDNNDVKKYSEGSQKSALQDIPAREGRPPIPPPHYAGSAVVVSRAVLVPASAIQKANYNRSYKDLAKETSTSSLGSGGQYSVVYNDGCAYTGELNKKGRKHGRGSMAYPDGSKFEGSWTDNVRSGPGKL
ncbi:hypothetical protein AGMMS49949_07790 [Alphaproteobacteria bacterium]|nr:hypothetical protein AGMMS49949_07790 [Alphaproteobacteria bacterium]GHS99005.1 hypothetical protein AGMMS50296_6960 [Alphaproteobacteria bacterium]